MSNVTPCFASSERTFAITRSDSTVWSSVMITTTFGRFAACCVPASLLVAEPENTAATAIPAARAGAMSHLPFLMGGSDTRRPEKQC